ncbi:toxin-antitoxin system YwqK family antitoxin [Hydrogenophaga luteola]|uniref:Toxin-antitoxin system YwqK family antitoxin n=1 Tax=Hydrogenophaga luteola TaxID=1591122 RepID=A0ABV7W6M5_9BURK
MRTALVRRSGAHRFETVATHHNIKEVKLVRYAKLFAGALALVSHVVQAEAPDTANRSLEGFPCLYSRQIVQAPEHCVVGYFDQNGQLIQEPLDASNLGDVRYYRVLHDRDKNSRFVIQAFFADGQRKTNRIAVEASGALLSRSSMADLKADGFVEMWGANGRKLAEQQYSRGVPHGLFKSWHDSGALAFSGMYRLGALDGRILDYHRNGARMQESYYRDGKLDGRLSRWYESGQPELRAEYVDGALMGRYVTFHPNGKRASESTRYFNAYEGAYRLWHESGTLSYEAHYKDGLLTRESRWYPNGKRAELSGYVSQVLDGEVKTWYMSGGIKSVETYRKGRRDGPFTRYYENGKKWVQGTYVDGELDGIHSQWELHKNQRVESTYVNGKKTGLKVFRPDGTVGEYDIP